MRTIIAGSRDCNDMSILIKALEVCSWEPSVVLCGMAIGADTLGRRWAKSLNITVEEYPAKWALYGKNQAGKIRNTIMASKAEALIALWDGFSSGTRNMIKQASVRDLKILVYNYTIGTVTLNSQESFAP